VAGAFAGGSSVPSDQVTLQVSSVDRILLAGSAGASAATSTTPRPAAARPAGAPGSEIERKFLIAERPTDLEAHPSESIELDYLAMDGPVEVRLRRRTPGRRRRPLPADHQVGDLPERGSPADEACLLSAWFGR